MPKLKDRVKQTTTSTGTGAVALSGAVSGFQTFAQAFTTGTQVYYCIADGTNWETGAGTYTAGSPGSLSRDTIFDSSNGGAAVSWGVGTKDVFVTVPASVIAVDGLKIPVVTKAVSYAAAASDFGSALKFTAAATLTLPAFSGVTAGAPLWVLNRGGSSASVSIATVGADTINGASLFIVRPGTDCLVVRGSDSYEVLSVGQTVYDSAGTWSPTAKGANISLSNNNMTATGSVSGYGAALATVGASSGKHYFEAKAIVPTGLVIGLARSTALLSTAIGADANGWGYICDGRKLNNDTVSSYGSATPSNGVVGIAADIDAGKMWLRVDGIWQGGGDPVTGANPMFTGVTGIIYPAMGDTDSSYAPSATLCLSAGSFTYTPPSGFSPFF